MTAWVVIALALATAIAPGDEVDGLIAGLSATRRGDRERAASRLEAIGEAARPALIRAVDSTDLELRAGAATVLDRIEGAALGRATPVTLDFRDRAIGEVVDALADRSGLGLVLEPGGDPRRGERRITLEGPGPVSFWEAVARLGEAGGLRIDPDGGGGGFRRFPAPAAPNRPRAARSSNGDEVRLVPVGGGLAMPTSRSGRFLVALTQLSIRADRTLPGPGGRPAGLAVEKFEAKLRLVAEPGLTLGPVGEVEAIEAVDDLGQSLVGPIDPAGPGRPETASNPYEAGGNGRAPTIVVRLRRPGRPGRRIARLAGVLQVTLIGTAPDPVVARLDSGFETPTRRGEVALTVHAVRASPDLPDQRLVEVSLERGGRQVAGARVALGPPAAAQGAFEFVDAKGRVVERVVASPFLVGDGRRRTIRATRQPGLDPAVALRYLSPTWAVLRVPFAFSDLPMP